MTGAKPRRALRTGIIIGLGAVAAAAIAATASAVVSVLVARTITRWPTRKPDELTILDADLDAGTLVLAAHPDSAVPGRYGLWFDESRGYARIGDIVAQDAHTVTRQLEGIDYGELRPPTGARLSGWLWRHPRELGVPYRTIAVPTALGPAPAWHIPVTVNEHGDALPNRDWAIVVHGHGSARPEGLRAVAPLREAGWDALLVSYRNDGTAPASPDGRTSLGDREWRDVESAIRFAASSGAERIVLVGFSLGGAIALQAATRSVGRERVVGVILDSPVVDWIVALDRIGEQRKLPGVVRKGALVVAGENWGGPLTGLSDPIDWRRLNFVARAGELTLPILLMHSEDDGYVVPDASLALAAARPDIVTFHHWTTALHAKLWNLDPERWERDVREWLARFDRPAGPREVGPADSAQAATQEESTDAPGSAAAE